MQMQGQRQLAATAEQAWQALNDPAILKACIPGCDRFEAQEDGVYALGDSIKIGPVSAKFSGRVTPVEVKPTVSYVLHFEVQGGAAGFGKGSSTLNLNPVQMAIDFRCSLWNHDFKARKESLIFTTITPICLFSPSECCPWGRSGGHGRGTS